MIYKKGDKVVGIGKVDGLIIKDVKGYVISEKYDPNGAFEVRFEMPDGKIRDWWVYEKDINFESWKGYFEDVIKE